MTAEKDEAEPRDNESEYTASVRKLLEEFYKSNPASYLYTHVPEEKGKANFCVIRKPWNDASLGLLAPEPDGSDSELVEALENIILPERLSAIYHKDIRMLEANLTAFKRPKEYHDIEEREFTFSLFGGMHRCRFGRSSNRLMELALATVLYGGDTSTNYRNMASFRMFSRPESEEESDRVSTPLSLFIYDVEWDEEIVISLVKHVNFYTKYYDFFSPVISIHEQPEIDALAQRSRYIDGKFPESISGRELNQILMSFWSAAHAEDDPARRFLYYFRVIEYVSFFHLDYSIKSAVRRTLSIPNLHGNLSKVADQVVSLVRDSKADEYARFKSTITDLVDPEHVLREIEANSSYFCKDIKFDGGFEMKALLPDTKSSEWGPRGMDNFIGSLRDIRNALSHGRDQKTGHVILPTRANLVRLQPWVHLISTAAGEVILYEGVS